MDLAALQQCEEADLRELGLSLGTRKKVLAAVHGHNAAAVAAATDVEVERRVAQQMAAVRREAEAAAAAAASAAAAAAVAAAATEVDDVPELCFTPTHLFAVGSPLALVLSMESHTRTLVSPAYALPGGTRVCNVFHPYDPLAHRLEPLLVAEPGAPLPPPQQLEHHAGRQRLHLALKSYVRRAGADLRKEVAHWASQAFASFRAWRGSGGEGEGDAVPAAHVGGWRTRRAVFVCVCVFVTVRAFSCPRALAVRVSGAHAFMQTCTQILRWARRARRWDGWVVGPVSTLFCRRAPQRL